MRLTHRSSDGLCRRPNTALAIRTWLKGGTCGPANGKPAANFSGRAMGLGANRPITFYTNLSLPMSIAVFCRNFARG